MKLLNLMIKHPVLPLFMWFVAAYSFFDGHLYNAIGLAAFAVFQHLSWWSVAHKWPVDRQKWIVRNVGWAAVAILFVFLVIL